MVRAHGAKEERILERDDSNSVLEARLEFLEHALLQVLREAVVVQEDDRRLATGGGHRYYNSEQEREQHKGKGWVHAPEVHLGA